MAVVADELDEAYIWLVEGYEDYRARMLAG
jgi:hypothetical protein